MTRVSLIRPMYTTGTYDPEVQEALGIETLAGYLRAHGHDVQLLDPMLTGQSDLNTARQAAAFGPDLAGVSLMSAGDLPSANAIMAKIRGFRPACRFVAGGNLVSTEPSVALDHLPPGTICIRYEGERPMLALARADPSADPLVATIESALVKEADGTVRSTPASPPLEALDELPWAAREFMAALASRELPVNIQGSRGCSGKCRYCCAPGFPQPASDGRRSRSPAHIAGEIQAIVEAHGARVYNFVDDDFLGPPREAAGRARRLAEEISARGLSISFSIQARPSSLSREAVRSLASAGLSYVFFGVESDDAAVLRSWDRGSTIARLAPLVGLLREYEVEAQAGCIMFHPHSTLEGIRRLSQTLRDHGLLNYRTATNRLIALPGSEMYASLHARGEISPGSPGPYGPPFLDSRVEALYAALTGALEPLRPVWVYAASRLPTIVAQARLDEVACGPRLAGLHGLLADLERHIAATLFLILGRCEAGDLTERDAGAWAAASLAVGMAANRALHRWGLVENADILRNAVYKSCGR